MTVKQAFEKLLRKKTFLFLQYSFVFDRNKKPDLDSFDKYGQRGTIKSHLIEFLEERDLVYAEGETRSVHLGVCYENIYAQFYMVLFRYMRRYFGMNIQSELIRTYKIDDTYPFTKPFIEGGA